MSPLRSIQYKALILLVAFTANFFVVCHCQATMPHKTLPPCCAKHMHMEESGSAVPQATTPHHPYDEKGGCQHTQAVKFQLLEKQIPDPVSQPPLLITFIQTRWVPSLFYTIQAITQRKDLRDLGQEKYAPPDFQALYQSFLI